MLATMTPTLPRGLVSLTFDDGPSAWTEPILDLLAAHGAGATFFVLGASIAGHESTLLRALAEGHELGLHGWSHRNLTALTDAEIAEEMESTAAELERIGGERPRLWRPPYFEADNRVRRVLASVEVGCTIAPEDFHWPAERTAAFVIDRLGEGAIVDLHDGRPPVSSSAVAREETVRALEPILEAIASAGLASVTVSKLLQNAR